MHGPMSGASEWGFISLAPEYLAACGKVLSRVKLSIDRMSAGFCGRQNAGLSGFLVMFANARRL